MVVLVRKIQRPYRLWTKDYIRVWTKHFDELNYLTDSDKFKKWCELMRIELKPLVVDNGDKLKTDFDVWSNVMTKSTEYHLIGYKDKHKLKTTLSYSDRIIQSIVYSSPVTLPKDVIKCKGVYKGTSIDSHAIGEVNAVVDCYLSYTETTTTIFYPDPSSPIWDYAVYDEDPKEFIKNYGYIVRSTRKG